MAEAMFWLGKDGEDRHVRSWSDLDIQIAQLRHAYHHLAAERVIKQRQFADGLIAPVIRFLEGLPHGKA